MWDCYPERSCNFLFLPFHELGRAVMNGSNIIFLLPLKHFSVFFSYYKWFWIYTFLIDQCYWLQVAGTAQVISAETLLMRVYSIASKIIGNEGRHGWRNWFVVKGLGKCPKSQEKQPPWLPPPIKTVPGFHLYYNCFCQVSGLQSCNCGSQKADISSPSLRGKLTSTSSLLLHITHFHVKVSCGWFWSVESPQRFQPENRQNNWILNPIWWGTTQNVGTC